jgi:FKBP-type peptidyl-prolyl cis-trans isomerase
LSTVTIRPTTRSRRGRATRALVLGAVLAAACGDSSGRSDLTALVVETVREGGGAEAVAGARVSVHYTGWLYDGSREDRHGPQFDSSRDRDQAFAFVLGVGQVIPGWDQGVAGMRVGGRRTLIVPPGLAYGAAGAGEMACAASIVTWSSVASRCSMPRS